MQLYSASVYEGPGPARRIDIRLVKLLDRNGFANIAEAGEEARTFRAIR